MFLETFKTIFMMDKKTTSLFYLWGPKAKGGGGGFGDFGRESQKPKINNSLYT